VYQPINSVNDLLGTSVSVCTRSLFQDMVSPIHSSLIFQNHNREYDYVASLKSGACEVALLGVATVEHLLGQSENCGIQMTGSNVVQKINGWITNRASSCVSHAIGYEIEVLETQVRRQQFHSSLDRNVDLSALIVGSDLRAP